MRTGLDTIEDLSIFELIEVSKEVAEAYGK